MPHIVGSPRKTLGAASRGCGRKIANLERFFQAAQPLSDGHGFQNAAANGVSKMA